MKFHLSLCVFILLSLTSVRSQNEINPDGYNRFYHENGKISSEGYMRQGKPDGYWKTYYEHGAIKSEGNRNNYLLDSIWTFYNDSGRAYLQVTYLKGKKDGLRRTILEDEIIEESFTDDVKQGMAYHYFPDGKLKRELMYVDGLEEGIGKEYSRDGRVIRLISYRKGFITDIEHINSIDRLGFKQGRWVEFYENGQVRMEGEYKDSMRHGYFKEYDEEGNLVSTSKYIDDVLQENVEELARLDIKTEYYPSGSVKIVASYKNDIAEGVRREYGADGQIVRGYLFSEGKMVGEGITDDEGIRDGPWKEYYFDASLKSEGTYDKGKRTGEWRFYHRNGQLEQTGSYNSDGKADGLWQWFYPSGDILREETYFNGQEDGLSTEYDENGMVVTQGEYIEGNREGGWIIVYGDFREEGEYLNGLRNGSWKSFDRNGTLLFEGKFIDDIPNGRHTWYWPNGTKKQEGEYIMGLKDGDWVKYYSDGTPLITISYKNGIETRYDGIRVRVDEDEKEEKK
ncbi:MAG: toxin-antitoxin system YwqK family antitoxin [Bacteroidales bacterium]|nr:toxin-antitoxin system YwqK family antitoxin [Bacteroidales bacterium]